VPSFGTIQILQLIGAKPRLVWSANNSAWAMADLPRMDPTWSTSASQGMRQVQRKLVAAQAEYLHDAILDQILQQSADGDQQLVARAVAQVVVDVFEMIDVEQQH